MPTIVPWSCTTGKTIISDAIFTRSDWVEWYDSIRRSSQIAFSFLWV